MLLDYSSTVQRGTTVCVARLAKSAKCRSAVNEDQSKVDGCERMAAILLRVRPLSKEIPYTFKWVMKAILRREYTATRKRR